MQTAFCAEFVSGLRLNMSMFFSSENDDGFRFPVSLFLKPERDIVCGDGIYLQISLCDGSAFSMRYVLFGTEVVPE